MKNYDDLTSQPRFAQYCIAHADKGHNFWFWTVGLKFAEGAEVLDDALCDYSPEEGVTPLDIVTDEILSVLGTMQELAPDNYKALAQHFETWRIVTYTQVFVSSAELLRIVEASGKFDAAWIVGMDRKELEAATFEYYAKRLKETAI